MDSWNVTPYGLVDWLSRHVSTCIPSEFHVRLSQLFATFIVQISVLCGQNVDRTARP
jgi:hypothetical protein